MLFFGAQQFRIEHCAESNCLRIDLVGSSGIAVLEKVLELLHVAISECFRMLVLSTWLPLPPSLLSLPHTQTLAQDQGQGQGQEQEPLQSHQRFVNFLNMRTCIEESQPLRLHDDKNKRVAGVSSLELSVQEQKRMCAAFLVNLELLPWYHVFVSYRRGPQDKPLVDGLFTRCTLHNAGPPDFQVRHIDRRPCLRP